MIIALFATVFLACLIAAIVKFFVSKSAKSEENDENHDRNDKSVEKPTKTDEDFRKSSKDDDVTHKKASKNDLRKKKDTVFTHPWLSTILKGHSGHILDFDFSANGKLMVTCSDDRSILIWNTSEFEEKEHKVARGNIELDHAAKICMAPDSKSILVYLEHDDKIAVYKTSKKEGSASVAGGGLKVTPVEGVEFPIGQHKMDVIALGISCSGKFVMTASSDTTLIVWDLKGNVLKTLDTKQGQNFCAKVSPCGRFIASSGFVPDVKVWEVCFAKNGGEFQDVNRAFELKGHSSGVRSFDFNQDSTRMVSASKDGTFRVWNTDIRYQMGQEPYLLLNLTFDPLKTTTSSDATVMAAVAPNGDTVALAVDRQICIFCALTGAQLGRVDDVLGGHFSAGLKFTADSRYLVTGRDKQALVFHNVAGYMVASRKAKEQVKKATSSAHKERLQQQADEAEAIVKKFATVT